MLIFLAVIDDVVKRDKLEEMYVLYKKDLIYTAYKILGDYHEAEDVVQTAILKVSEHLDKLQDINCNKTRSFIVVIVRNLVINIYLSGVTSTPAA
ncbi:sigma-70 family RNA polymerase sigma factor [Alkaliphilus pronyensis]|uniref:Sigma-70 family RNA polymerase sigma factor n=1 Tax=Alkaliphilus pronyensis TaxID=1482732 RepID=A0A6I0FC39_9FIRM|nr:sigma-70 family RNA polymerase sigma factor [Alkaliphilus pronyensis]KAB3535525.1 sigma-70 family RNA polymerase sigma factor [Alkaliphilus pronyensis]